MSTEWTNLPNILIALASRRPQAPPGSGQCIISDKVQSSPRDAYPSKLKQPHAALTKATWGRFAMSNKGLLNHYLLSSNNVDSLWQAIECGGVAPDQSTGGGIDTRPTH